ALCAPRGERNGRGVGPAVFADNELALVGREANAVGLVDASGDGMRSRHVARTGRHADDLPRAGVSEVNPAGLRDDEVVGAHLDRDRLHRLGRGIDDDDLLGVIRAWALRGGVELAIGPELHAAALRSAFQPDDRMGLVHADAVEPRFAEVAEIEISFSVTAGGVGEAITFADELPIAGLAA